MRDRHPRLGHRALAFSPCLPGLRKSARQDKQPRERNMIFNGRDRADVKRKALSYWASNSGRLGLSLRAFLGRCRLGVDERTITFTAPN